MDIRHLITMDHVLCGFVESTIRTLFASQSNILLLPAK